jgi:hypothetical protein
MTETNAPDAELLIAPGCPHCPAVLTALADLLKQARLGRLTVINLATHPEEGERRGARGVPWIRIGPFIMTGAHRPAELEAWVTRAASEDGQRSYLLEQLGGGELSSVVAACRRDPALLTPLLSLAGDLETPYAVRIGIGAVLEDLGPDGLLHGMVPVIEQDLADSEHPSVRADAAHFLGLTGSTAARTALERLAQDTDPSVREIAVESLGELDDDELGDDAGP